MLTEPTRSRVQVPLADADHNQFGAPPGRRSIVTAVVLELRLWLRNNTFWRQWCETNFVDYLTSNSHGCGVLRFKIDLIPRYLSD